MKLEDEAYLTHQWGLYILCVWIRRHCSRNCVFIGNISNKIGGWKWKVRSKTCSLGLSKPLDVAIFEQLSLLQELSLLLIWLSGWILPSLVTFSALSAVFSISSYTSYYLLHDSFPLYRFSSFMTHPSIFFFPHFFQIPFTTKFGNKVTSQHEDACISLPKKLKNRNSREKLRSLLFIGIPARYR